MDEQLGLHHPFRVCAWIVFAGDYGCCAFVNPNILDSASIVGGGGGGMQQYSCVFAVFWWAGCDA